MAFTGVRPARVADADSIGAINLSSWQHRLVDVLPGEALSSLRAGDLALVWAGAVMNPPTPHDRVLVAVQGEDIVGYTAVGASPDPDADAVTGEMVALEVEPRHQRQGHGSRLMTAAVDIAREAGFTTLTVWCPLDDEVRRAFLQSAGWGPDSARREIAVGVDDAGDPVLVQEARLVTAIGPDGA